MPLEMLGEMRRAFLRIVFSVHIRKGTKIDRCFAGCEAMKMVDDRHGRADRDRSIQKPDVIQSHADAPVAGQLAYASALARGVKPDPIRSDGKKISFDVSPGIPHAERIRSGIERHDLSRMFAGPGDARSMPCGAGRLFLHDRFHLRGRPRPLSDGDRHFHFGRREIVDRSVDAINPQHAFRNIDDDAWGGERRRGGILDRIRHDIVRRHAERESENQKPQSADRRKP